MDFGKHEKWILIIALHKYGQSQSKIVILLKPLGINHLFVFCIVKRYNKMAYIVDRLREGCSHHVNLSNVIHAVCEHIRWNPLHKRKQMTAEMSVSTWNISCILQNDLKLGLYRKRVSHALTPKLREIRQTCCAALLQQFKEKKYQNILLQMRRVFLSRKYWIVRMIEFIHRAAIKPGRRCHRLHTCIIPHLWGFNGCAVWRHYPNSLWTRSKNW